MTTSANLRAVGVFKRPGRNIFSRYDLIDAQTGAVVAARFDLALTRQWLAYGAPREAEGRAVELPSTIEGPCMPPGQELIQLTTPDGRFDSYAEEAA